MGIVYGFLFFFYLKVIWDNLYKCLMLLFGYFNFFCNGKFLLIVLFFNSVLKFDKLE